MQGEMKMTESDRLVAMMYAASTHTLDEFLSRYEDCLAALETRRTASEADAAATIGDKLGGPA
jgi:hypothetical protein